MPGAFQIPNFFTNTPKGTTPFALLDADFTAIQNYINNTQPTSGLLANRPAAGNPGALYVATDVSGGTLYLDSGASWLQVASGVTAQAPQNTVIILASYMAASFGG